MSLHNHILSLLLHIKESQLWTYRQHFAILQQSFQKLKVLFFSWTVLVARLAFLWQEFSVEALASCYVLCSFRKRQVHYPMGEFLLSSCLLCSPCRFILYLINSVASAKGNIGKSRICKNFAEADHAWNTLCVPVHNLGCYNIVEGVDSHRYNSCWKARVIALMRFDSTHFCRIIVFGSSVSCSVSMTN